MKWILIGFGAYWILGEIRNSQLQAARVSCGGTQTLCYDSALQKWAWYPEFRISL